MGPIRKGVNSVNSVKIKMAKKIKSHIASIHKDVKFSCSACEYTTRVKRDLKRHIRVVHQGITYPCSHCDHKATDEGNLKRHIKLKH